MLANLHCNEFSSEKLVNALDVTRAELQDTDDELKSLTEHLAASRQRYLQLQKECQDAEEILHREVRLHYFAIRRFFFHGNIQAVNIHCCVDFSSFLQYG